MALGQTAQSALISWLNSFPLEFKVESVADLKDGLVFSKVLADIDPTYIRDHRPRPDSLRDVVKALFRYIESECEDLDPLLESPLLRAVADHGRHAEILEVAQDVHQDDGATVDAFLQIAVSILMAAISGPDREKYVVIITKLDLNVQSEIANIIQLKQKEIVEASASAADDGQSSNAPVDEFELEFEARYSLLIAQKKDLEQEKEQLKKQMADLTTRLERLQDNNELLQERLKTAEDGLHDVAREEDTSKLVKRLESKIRDLEELITNQERQLELDHNEKERLHTEIEALAKASELVTSLRDKNKELGILNLELTKKANALDHYKQKLESQRDFEATAQKLTEENEELKSQFRDNELLRHRNDSLQQSHDAFRKVLESREQEIFELSNQKRTLDEEKADLKSAVFRLEELKSAYEDRVIELSDHAHDRAQTPTAKVGPTMSSLEDELKNSPHETRLSLELSRLKAENQLLKSNVPTVQEATSIRARLMELENTRKLDTEKYNEIFERHVISSHQISALLDASTSKGLVENVNTALAIGNLEMLTPEYYSSEAFAEVQDKYVKALDRASSVESKNDILEMTLARTERNLLTTKTDLSMIASDEREALEAFKSSQEALSFSLGEELKALQSRHKSLQDDHEQKSSLLIQALLSKDKLQQAVTDLNERLTITKHWEVLDSTDADITEAKEVSPYGRPLDDTPENVQNPFSSDRFAVSDPASSAVNIPDSELTAELNLLGNHKTGTSSTAAKRTGPKNAMLSRFRRDSSEGRVVAAPPPVRLSRRSSAEFYEINLTAEPSVARGAVSPNVLARRTSGRFRFPNPFQRKKERK